MPGKLSLGELPESGKEGVYLPNQIFEQICMGIDREYGVDMPLYES